MGRWSRTLLRVSKSIKILGKLLGKHQCLVMRPVCRRNKTGQANVWYIQWLSVHQVHKSFAVVFDCFGVCTYSLWPDQLCYCCGGNNVVVGTALLYYPHSQLHVSFSKSHVERTERLTVSVLKFRLHLKEPGSNLFYQAIWFFLMSALSLNIVFFSRLI